MGIFTRKKETRTDDVTSSNDLVDDVLLTSLLRGDDVNPKSAMGIPAVASAVNRIAGLASMLPIKLYEAGVKDGKPTTKEIVDDDRVFFLNVDSGDTLDQVSIKRQLIKDYLLDKGGFLFIAHKGTSKVGEPTGLRYVPPTKVSAIINAVDPFNKAGQYIINGMYKEQFEFVALLLDTDDGFLGVPRTKQITNTLQTALSNIMYEQGIVIKGGAKKGFLQSTKNLSKPALQQLKAAWRELYSNTSENVVVLNSGVEFKEANSNAREMQVDERKKSLHDELLELFGIHNDNFEDIFRDAVAPVLEAFEAALNKSLLTEEEKKKRYFKFDTRQVLKASLKDRYDAYKTASEIGVLTKNEIRESENLAPIDGLDVVSMGLGDVVFDVNTKEYYTPNTGDTKKFGDPADAETTDGAGGEGDQANADEEATK